MREGNIEKIVEFLVMLIVILNSVGIYFYRQQGILNERKLLG